MATGLHPLPWAYNGSFGDNLSHSVNDEIGGSNTCNDAGNTFDWDKSLYNQPGVAGRGPIVNPLIANTGFSSGPDAQFRPMNDGNINTRRAKAIMSYACQRLNTNTFFEPVDVSAMVPGFAPFGGLGPLAGPAVAAKAAAMLRGLGYGT